MMDFYLVLTFAVLACIGYTDAACTMPEVLRGSSWTDNVKGTVSFTTWKMSGWSFTVDNQNVTDWEIVDNLNFEEKGFLALRSVQTFDYNSTTYYSYVCMKFEKISNDVYKYFTPHAQNPMADNNSVIVADHDDLTRFEEICDEQYVIDKKLFNVLIKAGQQPSFTCPNPILTTADFTVKLANDTVVCGPGSTEWQGCNNKRTLELNNTCSHPIAYSGFALANSVDLVQSVSTGVLCSRFTLCFNNADNNTNQMYISGRLNCISNYKDANDVTSVLLMNTDETVDDINTFRFACVIVKDDGTSMVITPKECFPSQTFEEIPTNRQGVQVGQKLSTNTISSDCRIKPVDGDDDEILSVPAIIGIVLGGLVFILLVIVVLYCCCKYRN